MLQVCTYMVSSNLYLCFLDALTFFTYGTKLHFESISLGFLGGML